MLRTERDRLALQIERDLATNKNLKTLWLSVAARVADHRRALRAVEARIRRRPTK